MKKTTYIIIGLLAAALLFAFLSPIIFFTSPSM